ncbi:hypothetical protein IPZ58_24140 [Streptomyces roseoverticillatus]|uniref:hypothetical protein n=1 Tax=Streptomyces roseoverticillatus TaxID=66429 RepID=UPI001F46DDB3|nr:hypothetical protein [Streptomyces roseoverticillatus]MCF3104658.1 hypothetical protein [Streptomyces roseoverticillatus]
MTEERGGLGAQGPRSGDDAETYRRNPLKGLAGLPLIGDLLEPFLGHYPGKDLPALFSAPHFRGRWEELGPGTYERGGPVRSVLVPSRRGRPGKGPRPRWVVTLYTGPDGTGTSMRFEEGDDASELEESFGVRVASVKVERSLGTGA